MDDKRIEELKKNGITFVKGRKSKEDKIFFYNEKPITFKEFGELYALFCNNEDVNYPYGKGGDLLTEFLEEVKIAGKVTDDIKKKYKL